LQSSFNITTGQIKEILKEIIKIYKMLFLGISDQELANEYGISTERIRQVFRMVKYKEEDNKKTTTKNGCYGN
jgi:hypothetical protein